MKWSLIFAFASCAVWACGVTGEEFSLPFDGGGSEGDADLRSVDNGTEAGALEAGADRMLAPDEPVVCAVTPCAVDLVGIDTHREGMPGGFVGFCARMDDGALRCWGSNPKVVPAFAPRAVEIPARVKRVCEGQCAIDEAGHLWVWGENSAGELGLGGGDGGTIDRRIYNAVQVKLPEPVVAAEVSRYGPRCAVLSSGELWCWGVANAGLEPDLEAGSGSNPSPSVALPHHVVFPYSLRDLAGNLGLTTEGRVMSWYRDERDTLGMGRDLVNPDVGVGPILFRRVAHRIQASPGQGCAYAEGTTTCWGWLGGYIRVDKDQYGQYVGNLPTDVSLPDLGEFRVQQIRLGSTPRKLDSATRILAGTLCLRITDGSVYCLGENGRGQLGREGPSADLLERSPAPTERVVNLAMSSTAVCALLKSGAVECWGGNDTGGLGRGTTDTDAHPDAIRVVF